MRIVPQASAGIVERLGRYQPHARSRAALPRSRSSTASRPLVDLREQVVAFPPQPVITQDNVTISIDTVFYFTVTDAFRATYEVANLLLAVEQLTVTTLRNVIGSLSLEEALTSRDKINADLRIVLDEATERWGIRVNRIELKSIDPPSSIQEAMEKQMRAEREQARRDPHRRGRQAGADPDRRRREAGGDPDGRRREDGDHPHRRGLQAVGNPPRRGRSRGDAPGRSRRSTTATRRPTSSPTSTSRTCRRSPTGRR